MSAVRPAWLSVVLLLLAALVLARLALGVRQEAAASAHERAVLERTVAAAGEERRRLGELEAAFASLPWLLRAESAAVAAADAQGLLTGRVEEAGGMLESVRVGEVEPGPPPRLPLEVRLSGDHRMLRDLLHALEYRTPRFVVETMEVRGEEAGVRLHVDLVLSVFLDLPEGTAETDSARGTGG